MDLCVIVVLAVVGSSAPTIAVPPLAGLTANALHDTFEEKRGKGPHEAIDLMAPRGTPVRAVVGGTIVRLFLSKPGGNTIYEFDNTGTFSYYYAHLDRYAINLQEGMHVEPGQVIGYVGSTGDANPTNPHLHFTIFKLGPEKHWWQGTPVNPYPILLRMLRRD